MTDRRGLDHGRDDDGGSQRATSPGIDRRRLLASLGGLGAAGALGGIGLGRGTHGFLRDTEGFAGSELRAGALDLVVDVESESGEWTTDGTVQIPVESLTNEDRTGGVTLTLGLSTEPAPSNPAYLWGRVSCPSPAGSMLAQHLTVTLTPIDCESDAPGTPIASWPANDVPTDLQAGVALSPTGVASPGEQPCIQPDEHVCLRVDWELDAEYGGAEQLALEFEFLAVQCRHTDGTTNPFGEAEPEPCPGLPPCTCCVRIGKLETNDDNALPAGTYAFTEGTSDYMLRVPSDPITKGGDEAVAVELELVPQNGAPAAQLCRVEIAASTGLATYDRPTLGAPFGATPYLYAPPRATDPVEPNDYYGISHITVSICMGEEDGECPADLVKEPRLREQGGGNNGGGNNGSGNNGGGPRRSLGTDALSAGTGPIPTTTADGGVS